MNRIERRFSELRSKGRCGLIPFMTAGDPHPAWTVALMHALVAAGADLIELGMPFSDPMADGPVIQQASERALAKGVGLKSVLAMVSGFRKADAHTPVILMGYVNPLEQYGYEKFSSDAARAGVDGVLLVDCPLEEADSAAALAKHGLTQIYLVAPTTADDRLERIAAAARGFVYYVSFAGVTGASRLSIDAVHSKVAALKARTETPVAVGFGVKDAAGALALSRNADAVVVGSALVERLAGARDEAAAILCARDFLAPIRAALDGVAAAAAA